MKKTCLQNSVLNEVEKKSKTVYSLKVFNINKYKNGSNN